MRTREIQVAVCVKRAKIKTCQKRLKEYDHA
jgi:hypothetical protein